MANPNPGRAGSENDKIFMAMACLVLKFSEDPVTKVGAYIVNQDGSVVGTGYNSMPKGTTGLPWDKDDPHWDKYSYGIKKVFYLSDKYQKKPEMVACKTMLAKAPVENRQYLFPRDDESAEILIDFRSFYGPEELEELKAKFANSEG